MDINSTEDFPDLEHSFLLTNFDEKFRNTKLLLQQITKYLPREIITRIIPTRNAIIIKSQDQNLASKIRNRHSFEIFEKQQISLASPTNHQSSLHLHANNRHSL